MKYLITNYEHSSSVTIRCTWVIACDLLNQENRQVRGSNLYGTN